MNDKAPSTNYPVSQLKSALQRGGFLARERGVDDELDSETWTALYLFAESAELDWSLDAFEAEDGLIPPAVVKALLSQVVARSLAGLEDEDDLVFDDAENIEDTPLDISAVEVFDLTEQHEFDPKKCRRVVRKVEQITTILLHQTGIKFGVGKRALATHGRREGLHRRFWSVACHVAALMNGDVLLINPWQRYVLHGHRSNRFSIGIEIEGLYAGIEGDEKTVSGHHANILTPRTIAAARKAVQVSVEQCRALGCPITKIAAHRNFHGSRVSDPGQEIWREVALWAVDELELTIDYDLATKSRDSPSRLDGLQIPRDWDPSAKVNYRGRIIR